jgi:hypothetical protein
MNLIEFLSLIIAGLLAIIAIKITFSFDINEYLKRRDEKLMGKVRNNCTHAGIEKIGDEIGIRSTFISPFGTAKWVCQRCGLTLYNVNREDENKRIKYYLENIAEFEKQEKKFNKLLRKAGYL